METKRPNPAVLAGVTVWRLVIAGAGLYGLAQVTRWTTFPPWSPVGFGWRPLSELSQQASLAAGLCYLGLALYPLLVRGRRYEPRRAWLVGALTVVMWLVSLTSILVFDNHGQLGVRGFLFEHLVTPLLVTVDFVFVGRGQHKLRPWYPVTWLAPPLAYFVFLATDDFEEYPGLFDPDDMTQVAVTFVMFFAALLAAGYLLYGIGRLKGYLLRGAAPAATQPVASQPVAGQSAAGPPETTQPAASG